MIGVDAWAEDGPAAKTKGLANPFFAMDTATQDASHRTPESQARMLKELGYAGIGWGPGGIPQMLKALDAEGLKMCTIYVGVQIDPDQPRYDPQVPKAIAQLKGRDTIVWLYVTSRKHKPSSVEADPLAVEAIREIADMARKSGLRVALYPHTWFWVERTQDAVRVVKKVNRPNVGVTFNLCHCLRVGDQAKIPAILKEAMPHLFVVSVNGADPTGDWDKLIQTLDRGSFDVAGLLRTLKGLGYTGPIGFQGYGIKGDAHDNLKRTIDAWKKLSAKAVTR
jgi:sugar phosphate isomerase/epimerase